VPLGTKGGDPRSGQRLAPTRYLPSPLRYSPETASICAPSGAIRCWCPPARKTPLPWTPTARWICISAFLP